MLDRAIAEDMAKQPDDAAQARFGPRQLVVNGLVLEADGKRLIDGIDLRLDDGAATIIMGANGAGKSLLLRLLHGLIQPTEGAIAWDGEAMSDTVRARQAMVFQRPVLLRRSVAANIDFALRLKDKIDGARRDELLQRVGLLEQSRQPARLLSNGEQQRLALARALATQPEVLFLDEPTASLDPASIIVIEEIVATTKAAGTKIIFVTHDIGQARRLGDEIVFLDRGRLAEHTPAERFFASPDSAAGQAYVEGRLIA